jgi:hypothetical protein
MSRCAVVVLRVIVQNGLLEGILSLALCFAKSPLLPLSERGKSCPSPPLCKGEPEGILDGSYIQFLRSVG